MRIIRVIESKVWLHTSGRRASIYGASPWVSRAERDDWTMISQGWTWEIDDGTVGFGRVPAQTEAEAIAFMDAHNAKRDADALASLPAMIAANKAAVAQSEAWLKEADYPALKRSAKRRLQEDRARLASCESRLASLLTVGA